MDKQLNEAQHQHRGILQLLQKLKHKKLIRNKPSENWRLGLGAAKVSDSDAQREIGCLGLHQRACRESESRPADHGPPARIFRRPSRVSILLRGWLQVLLGSRPGDLWHPGREAGALLVWSAVAQNCEASLQHVCESGQRAGHARANRPIQELPAAALCAGALPHAHGLPAPRPAD